MKLVAYITMTEAATSRESDKDLLTWADEGACWRLHVNAEGLWGGGGDEGGGGGDMKVGVAWRAPGQQGTWRRVAHQGGWRRIHL